MEFLENIKSLEIFVTLKPVIDVVTKPAFFLALLFVVALIYSLYAKARDKKAAKKAASAPAKPAAAPAKAATAPAANISVGELDLIETDEKTAAVIMAIVSHQSGIPLNRLSFKSIRLVEDK